MPFQFNKSLRWIGLALERAFGKGGGTDDPNTVIDVVVPMLDALGWARYAEVASFSRDGALGSELVDPDPTVTVPAGRQGWADDGTGIGIVPSGFLRVIPWAQIQHNDPANTEVWIDRADRRGNPLGITYMRQSMDAGAQSTIPSGRPVAITRPIILNPGDSIRGRGGSIAAGFRLTWRVAWIDLQPGEYLR